MIQRDPPPGHRLTEADIREALDDMVACNGGKLVSADSDLNVFKNMPYPAKYLRVFRK